MSRRRALPGNVRELETVLAQALLLRGEGQVQLEDLAQPDETGAVQAVREPVPKRTAPDLDELMEWPQQEALRIAAARGLVRRGDLTARCGISTESARKYLVGLVERRLLQRAGGGRGARYVLVRPQVDHDRELRGRPKDRKRNAEGRKRKEAQPGGKP